MYSLKPSSKVFAQEVLDKDFKIKIHLSLASGNEAEFAVGHIKIKGREATFELSNHMILFGNLQVNEDVLDFNMIAETKEILLNQQKERLLISLSKIDVKERRTIAKLSEIVKLYFNTWHVGVKSSLDSLGILKKYQIQKHRNLSQYPLASKKTIKDAFYIFNIVLCSYGWQGLNFCGYGNTYLVDLIRLKSNKKIIREHLDLPKEHILKYSKKVKAHKPIFFVVYDQVKDTIVIVVRGTLSIQDCITDFVCQYYAWRGGYVHEGIFRAAVKVFEDLKPDLNNWTSKYKTNNIVVTGHSLGGGVTTILSRLVLEHNDNFRVKAFSYGAPPMVSRNLLPLFTHVESYIAGNDSVPGLSYGAMINVRDQIQLIHNNKDQTKENIFQDLDRVVPFEFPEMLIPGKVFWMHKYSEETTTERSYSDKPLKKQKPHTIMQQVDPKELLEIPFGKGTILNHLPNYYERSFLRSFQYLKEVEEFEPDC